MTASLLISIIDDDRSVRSGLSNLLQSAGYATICFESAEEFLNDEALENSDFVILDFKLKGINGFELIRRLEQSRPSPPVMLISGHGDEDMGKPAISAGAVVFMRKPIDVDLLLEHIQRVLAKRGGSP
ncbi:response regulator transcription factor [Acerihabitans arboris]|uniref:Response regulator n=1 Tax=Acerihabitans arboris TaxID=2691583 RepID=A0A845SR87_9GAMM|nr:response regulator [Acerihabitans arboris]NDL65138.1 response regulator [Acerihabitans arboris]